MILSQFKEVIWHWRSSDGDVAEPWHHSGEIVSSVETIFEFGEVARYMLVPDGTVSAGDGAFDVSEGRVDPLERGGQSDLAARSSDERLMDAPGVADTRETAQTVTDDSASGIEIAPPGLRSWTTPSQTNRLDISSRAKSNRKALLLIWRLHSGSGNMDELDRHTRGGWIT